MARKKQEIALQIEINTQEEWDDFMKKEGLLVIDVYQDWCGPCKAVTSFFRRIKNEIGDDFLNFAVAKADTIDHLEKYRGKSEPCFLIYGGRALVGVIRGANPPVLESTIKIKLEEEHKVMKGEMERKETKDPLLADSAVEEKVQEMDKDENEMEREVTIALIKPDVVKAGRVDDIIGKLQEKGIEILAQVDRNLTTDEARQLYHHMEDSEFFEELIKFISSGPSKILVLAKGDQGIIQEFRELIGPKVLDEAKEKAPQSLRAIYGTTSIENAIHSPEDRETVQRELAFFFPDFVVPRISGKPHEEDNVQRTLALIRPVAFSEFKDAILEKITNAGFKIALLREVQLTREDVALFYAAHKDKPYFEELVSEMSKGTLLALALEKQNAVQGWRGMLGPKDVKKAKETDPDSLRAQFYKDDIKINLLHGSDSDNNAEQELKYFFPVEQTIAAIKPDGMENEEEIMSRIIDAKFHIAKSKRLDMEKTFAEEFYSDQQHQEYFNELIEHMQSGPTLVMILSRQDAIRGWRSLIGPKDPKIADETYPDSIRAIYGRDIKKNAVFGSETEAEVQRVMNLVFGDLEFDQDGLLLTKYMEKADDVQLATESDLAGDHFEVQENVGEGEESSKQESSSRLFQSNERILMEPEVSELAEHREEKAEHEDRDTDHETDNKSKIETEEKPLEDNVVVETDADQAQQTVNNDDSNTVTTEDPLKQDESKQETSNIEGSREEMITVEETKEESEFEESKQDVTKVDETETNDRVNIENDRTDTVGQDESQISETENIDIDENNLESSRVEEVTEPKTISKDLVGDTSREEEFENRNVTENESRVFVEQDSNRDQDNRATDVSQTDMDHSENEPDNDADEDFIDAEGDGEGDWDEQNEEGDDNEHVDGEGDEGGEDESGGEDNGSVYDDDQNSGTEADYQENRESVDQDKGNDHSKENELSEKNEDVDERHDIESLTSDVDDRVEMLGKESENNVDRSSLNQESVQVIEAPPEVNDA